MRIALIHALAESVAPAAAAFARLWPEPSLANLLDDSLSADRARAGRLDAAMSGRFEMLARYAVASGADGILFTCSAFGPCIEHCQRLLSPLPVLKPNQAMIEEVVVNAGPAGRIGLLASFAPTLASMPPEFARAAPGLTVVPRLAEGALAALAAGDAARHDALAAAAAADLAGCDLIVLAQFSLARAAAAIAAATGRPVVTTPDSAVRRLKARLRPD